MREFWQNVEIQNRAAVLGCRWETLALAIKADGSPPNSDYRIHVRLKPEGAPRRYASEDQRWWWEHEPIIAAIRDRIT